MGYYTYVSYGISGQFNNGDPADNTSYLVSPYASTFATTDDYQRYYVTRPGIVRKVYVYWYSRTQNASAENTSIYIRKNNTTDSTGWTGSFANASAPITFDANLAVAVGDFLHLKISTPAWVTNPTGCYLSFVAEIQC